VSVGVVVSMSTSVKAPADIPSFIPDPSDGVRDQFSQFSLTFLSMEIFLGRQLFYPSSELWVGFLRKTSICCIRCCVNIYRHVGW